MRRTIIYSACALLTFTMGVTAVVAWLMHERPPEVKQPRQINELPTEKQSPAAEPVQEYISFEYLGAEREFAAGGGCVSVQRYLSGDGVEIRSREDFYKTFAQAEKAFRKALADELEIIEQRPIMNDRGVRLGESATTLHSDSSGKVNAYSRITWLGPKLYRYYSPSEQHLLHFVNDYVANPFVDVCR
jgi:hypothetical protein